SSCRLHPRPQERADTRRDHRRPSDRRHHRGRRGDRDRLHVAGGGPPGRGLDLQPRLHRRPGRRPAARLLLHGGHSRRRPGLRPLSPGHALGTDELGRDQISRILWGARISLPVAFVAVAVGLVAGGLIGLVSGYAGGLTDLLLMRVIDALLAFPALILAIALVAALGPSLRNAMIAIGIVAIPAYARLV